MNIHGKMQLSTIRSYQLVLKTLNNIINSNSDVIAYDVTKSMIHWLILVTSSLQ